jgi:hypothetical protein
MGKAHLFCWYALFCKAHLFCWYAFLCPNWAVTPDRSPGPSMAGDTAAPLTITVYTQWLPKHRPSPMEERRFLSLVCASPGRIQRHRKGASRKTRCLSVGVPCRLEVASHVLPDAPYSAGDIMHAGTGRHGRQTEPAVSTVIADGTIVP